MQLDVNTLFQVTIYVEAMLGLLLLFAWVQNTSITAVAWWGNAHLLRSASIMLFGMYGNVPNVISIDLANALLFTSFAATWTGARAFDGRSTRPAYIVAGAILWLVLCRIPVISDSIDLRILLSSGIITCYIWQTAYQFWIGRKEALVSRTPATFMLFGQGALFLLRTPLSLVLPWSPNQRVFDSVWMTVLSFEALLFTIAVAFVLLAMAKERTEQLHKTASMIDPLTGIPNRRAFLEQGVALLKKGAAGSRPSAVLLLDLDHFKSVNDRFGHAVGDKVLQIFSRTASAMLTPADIFGRLGGEEFGVVLNGADRDKAVEIADAIRIAFQESIAAMRGKPASGTVSIGVVVCGHSEVDMHALLAAADEALYCAKERGRNRVEVASLQRTIKRETRPARSSLIAAKSAAA